MCQKAFTLTEVLIVIVIAAVLVFLVVPNGLRALHQANISADQSNINSIKEAIMMCWHDEKDFDNCDSQDELYPDYIDPWPDAPCGGDGYTLADQDNPPGVTVTNPSPCSSAGDDDDVIAE